MTRSTAMAWGGEPSGEPETAPGVVPKVIFGCSEVMRAVRTMVEKVARADIPVLIEGESGTGKEVLANLVHRCSLRRNKPFVKVSCPAIPATLLESELFGYEKGAFTGANGPKPGWVEQADGGTLFLDEIAEFDIAIQAKLLQLLQDGQFFRIGGKDGKWVDVRVISATNRRLEHEVKGGRFRRDLYYRINVVSIRVPPLRERRCDIPDLVSYFLKIYNDKYQCHARPLSPRVCQKLMLHDWPGNVRQLENLIRRYVVLGSEEIFRLEIPDGPARIALPVSGAAPLSLRELTQHAIQSLERELILDVLRAHKGNRKQAARALNISYRALFYKIRDTGLPGKKALTAAAPDQQKERR